MSAELQPALLMLPPSGLPDSHLLIVFAIMLLTGIMGGVANYFLVDRQGEPAPRERIKYPVLGVVAALTAPLFLNMLSSSLLEGARTKPLDLLVFAGFCLIYVIASRRLFENIAARLAAQVDGVRQEVRQLKQQQELPPASIEARREPAKTEEPKTEPREFLSYNDVEILRALVEESIVYGNLAALCDHTGLSRDFVSQRLGVMKNLGVIETRINEKNVLHWFVSFRGKQLLNDVLTGQQEKKTA